MKVKVIGIALPSESNTETVAVNDAGGVELLVVVVDGGKFPPKVTVVVGLAPDCWPCGMVIAERAPLVAIVPPGVVGSQPWIIAPVGVTRFPFASSWRFPALV